MSVLVGRKAPCINAHTNINGEDVEAISCEIEILHNVFFFYPKDYLNKRNKNRPDITFNVSLTSCSK